MNPYATSTPTADGGGDRPIKKPKGAIEKMYQKKSQLEHILLRPDTYIGSVEKVTECMWVYDKTKESMIQKVVSYVPGLYKIFDEILVNAADNKQRDPKMDCIKINIDAENNEISVWNNGKGIPVVEHKDEKMFVPTMIFGHLLTSSNYDDEEEKVTGGRNGYGAKLCNIFSTKFVVETACKEYKRKFKQSWSSNMTKTTAPVIKDSSEDFTKITFSPDLAKFKMEKLDEDIVQLMSRRAYDVAASAGGVKVFLNDQRIQIKNFKDYVDLFMKSENDETDNVKIIYEKCNPRWEVAVALSEKGFQQMSFVNSIATTKGGRHVDYISDMVISQLIKNHINKKKNKDGVNIKPFQVKNYLWVFINCLIVNPTFDSQTKENMTLQAKNFKSTCSLTDKFYTAVSKSGIVEAVLAYARFKAENQLGKKSGKKQNKLKGVPKLEDANDAGTKNSINCTLILTEGDSAKSLAVSGLGVIGRDLYGVFPLRGKLLNVREASHKQILENAEINNIVKIVGLQYKKKYETTDDLKTLRYGKIMIMTDQDQDGSHIKGLIINFIHHNWPSLLKLPFLEEFITPIIKATRKINRHESDVLSFFSIPEFEEWKNNTANWNRYTIKYYKGLGTSTTDEAKEYFSNMIRHRILFKHRGDDDDSHITMAFSKKMVEARKDWLTNWMTETKRRKELGLGEDYLYAKDTRVVSYKDFINKELVLFSNMDNERSIPSVMDGLKPGSRKVLFTCLKRNLNKELKVAQLAGSVAEISAYHHGETSLMSTIINLAQNYVGSNNINLLQPIGMFGTRLQGGKDAASPRYIYTKLSPLTRLIYHPNDDPLLNYLRDDNLKIEPEWYVPILPMVLVNGADGIGTGWMTKIPNHNPREIIENLQRMIRGDEPVPMKPWYKGFNGEIEKLGETRFVTSGEVGILSDEKIEITELPVLTWTQAYKENVLEPLLTGGEKDKTPGLITNYKEYNTDTTVKFQVFMAKDKLKKAEMDGLHKIFKLQSTFSTASMCSFDRYGVLRRYDSSTQILKEFFDVRLEFYGKRKSYLEGMLEAEANKLSNQARFIVEKCDGDLRIENRKKKEMIAELLKRNYPGDPVRAWKLRVDRETALEEEGTAVTNEQEAGEEEAEIESDPMKDFEYLLGMKLWSLTLEKKNELLKKRDEKNAELAILKNKSPTDLWQEDLDALLAKLDELEQQLREDAAYQESKGSKSAQGRGGGGGKKKKLLATADCLPSPHAIRIAPKIDSELLKKAEKADQQKEKGKRAPATKKVKDDPDNPDEKSEEKPKKERKPKKEKVEKASPKKRGKKLSDSEIESSSDSESDDDFSSNVKVNTTPVRTTARRAAANIMKFTEDDSDLSLSNDDGNEEFFDNVAVAQNYEPEVVSDLDDSAPVQNKRKKPAVLSESDDLMNGNTSADSPQKLPPKKAPKLASTANDSDSDSGKKKKKPPVAKKAKSTKTFMSDDDLSFNDRSESDSDFDSKKKKPKTTKAAPKRKPAEKAPKKVKEPKKPAARKAPAKKTFDDSSDEGAKSTKRKAASYSSESEDDLFKNKKEPANIDTDSLFDSMVDEEKNKRAAASKKSEYSFEPSEHTFDNSSDVEYKPETKKAKGTVKPPAKKRATVKKKTYKESSGSDFLSD